VAYERYAQALVEHIFLLLAWSAAVSKEVLGMNTPAIGIRALVFIYRCLVSERVGLQ